MGRGIGRLRHPPSDLSCWLLQVIASSPLPRPPALANLMHPRFGRTRVQRTKVNCMLRFAYTPVIDRDHRAKNRGFSGTPGSGRTLQWSVAKLQKKWEADHRRLECGGKKGERQQASEMPQVLLQTSSPPLLNTESLLSRMRRWGRQYYSSVT
ncbi:hypothetical protein An14g03380 [Aspergillus niger]|uniref:Uncharacterized protein n=2 Tax=Aspergillus niger TaxID=5061 RepID=A2R383_ASPNC|nr:hypothetical protein An14g03380 [Aspergillus niger]CAK46575.1 hypothetical protein An14g03380 [Aspergillus niger]